MHWRAKCFDATERWCTTCGSVPLRKDIRMCQQHESSLYTILSKAYREKRACNAILPVKTLKSLLLLRIALSVINYRYGIRRVNGN